MQPNGGKHGGGGRFADKNKGSSSKFASSKRLKDGEDEGGENAGEAAGEQVVINFKQYMAPIEYHSTMADKVCFAAFVVLCLDSLVCVCLCACVS